MTAAQNLHGLNVPAAIGCVARTCHTRHVLNTTCCNIDAQHCERTEKATPVARRGRKHQDLRGFGRSVVRTDSRLPVTPRALIELLAHFVLEIDMKLVRTLLALALAGAMGSAAAATITYIGPGYLGDLVGQTAVINNTINGYGTPIADMYDFDIGSITSEAIASSVKIKLQYGSASQPIFDISNFAIALKNVNGFTYATDNTFDALGQLELSANLDPSALGTPGFYQFVVTGTTAGTSGGTYLGTLSAAPIPEAKTYAMMFAGLGLIGFTVLRRRGA